MCSRRLGAHDRRRVVDRVHHDRVEQRLVGGRGEVDLVFLARTRAPASPRRRRRRAEPGRLPEAGDLREHAVELARRHEVVALVLDVVAQHDVADSHAPQQRDDAGRIGDALLEAAVERVEEVGGARRCRTGSARARRTGGP